MDKNPKLESQFLNLLVVFTELIDLFLISEQSSELKYQEKLKLKERVDLENVNILCSELFVRISLISIIFLTKNGLWSTGYCKSPSNVRRTKR